MLEASHTVPQAEGAAPTGAAVVLLTGATGFVGKVVLAELVRRRAELGLARVYVLIRAKKGKTPIQRFAEDVAPARLFDGLPAGWTAMVTPVAGELAEADGGLGADDLAMLRAELTHVIHCAASVDFDLPIGEAAEANVVSALHVLALARSCARMRHVVSVSTAYVTPWRAGQGPIAPALVPLPFDPAQAFADIRAGRADAAALMAASGHPNTYTLTKCIAEHLLVAGRGDVPLTIVRPSIVSATLRHPLPGWIDSAAAFAGFVALIGAGQLRALVADPTSRLDVIPCDAVAEVVIDEAFAPPPAAQRLVHAAAGPARSLGVQLCIDGITGHFQRAPGGDRPARVRWVGPLTATYRWHELRHHTLPLGLGQVALRASGQARQARFVKRLAEKLRYVNRSFEYFTHNAFDFGDARPASLPGFEPAAYVDMVCAGVRRQILRLDPRETSLAGRKHRDARRSDLAWALGQPEGNRAIRSFGYVLRKATRRSNDHVTFDKPSFERVRDLVAPDTAVVLVPSHRSYMDFLFCSYLFFAHPELRIRIPHIAAAEEFSRIPVLGTLFTKTHAFYLRRGVGREDPELTRTVHGLVDQGAVVQFFIEGARSRSRQFLQPRTGLLRCLQATGRRVAVLPIAITYDRVPEEALLARELAGEPKGRMSLRALVGWAAKMARGEVALGRIHLVCGTPVQFGPDDDVKAVARQVMHELQAHTAVSTYHLRCFAQRVGAPADTAAWLADALRRRGAPILDSALGGEAAVDPVTELSLRQQWLPWFYAEALARWPGSPTLAHEVAARRWVTPLPTAPDPRLDGLLDAMFAPLLRDAAAVVDRLGDPRWSPRFETAAAVLGEAPEVHLLHAQAVFDDLAAQGILAKLPDGKLYGWGPHADAIHAYRDRCRAAVKQLDAAAPGGARRLQALVRA